MPASSSTSANPGAPLAAQGPDASAVGDWLDYIQTLHCRTMDLTLDRVREVVGRLPGGETRCTVISIAGTNGKGSVGAMLESIYRQAGYATGLYSSPHLVRFNERIKINGEAISDADLLDEFRQVEAVRGAVPLTYFEFGTAMAIDRFRRRGVDVAIMEVGLGGRLDAVNVLDADIACITSIGTDHSRWLGKTRAKIGSEKAGILRRSQIAVSTDGKVPQSVLDRAQALATKLHVNGTDFSYGVEDGGWTWRLEDASAPVIIKSLPMPPLDGTFQLDNCAGAVAAVVLGRSVLEVSDDAIRAGIESTEIPGRLQTVRSSPQVLLDVGHNVEAVRALSEHLRRNPVKGRSVAVFSALSEKPLEAMVKAIRKRFSAWHLCPVGDAARGISGEELMERVGPLLPDADGCVMHRDPQQALAAALAGAGDDDRIVVFGSFLTVGGIIAAYL